MDIVIIEDEYLLAEELEDKLMRIDKGINVIAKLDSVSQSIEWLGENSCDLIFLDVHLSDGISFSIFEKVDVSIPIIFTTAYNQYSIKAFDLNSVAYLLKPVDEDKLKAAIGKFKRFWDVKGQGEENHENATLAVSSSDPREAFYEKDYSHRINDLLEYLKKQDSAKAQGVGSTEAQVSAQDDAYGVSKAKAIFPLQGGTQAHIGGSADAPDSVNKFGPDDTLAAAGLVGKTYRKRFMLNMGKVQKPVSVEDIAYFMADDKYLFAFTTAGEKFFCDSTLTKLEDELDPDIFFRVNRKFFVSIRSVNELIPYSKSRIKIKLLPESEEDVVISSAKAKEFKEWLTQ